MSLLPDLSQPSLCYRPGITQGARPRQCFPLSFGMSLREMLVQGHQPRCVSRAFLEQDEKERNLNLQCW